MRLRPVDSSGKCTSQRPTSPRYLADADVEIAGLHELDGRAIAAAALGESLPGPGEAVLPAASLGESERTCSMNSS
jgi:hypothetical protein